MKVSQNSLSFLQRGHGLFTPSSPEYQVSTQRRQPRIMPQNLAAITGGLIGIRWHIVHRKHVDSNSFIGSGGVSLGRWNHGNACNCCRLFSMLQSLFSTLPSLDALTSGGLDLFFPLELLFPLKLSLLTAKTFVLGIFQNFKPNIKESITLIIPNVLI